MRWEELGSQASDQLLAKKQSFFLLLKVRGQGRASPRLVVSQELFGVRRAG